MEHCGVVISPASVSNIVRDAAELFHGEKEEIFRAGLAATTYQHIDDTFARVGGKFWHTHIDLQSVSLDLFHDTAQRPTDDTGPAAGAGRGRTDSTT